jgi:hypothetical protein
LRGRTKTCAVPDKIRITLEMTKNLGRNAAGFTSLVDPSALPLALVSSA